MHSSFILPYCILSPLNSAFKLTILHLCRGREMRCRASCNLACLWWGLRTGLTAGLWALGWSYVVCSKQLVHLFLRVQWMNITVFRGSCDMWVVTSLTIANSHRVMKTCLQSWNRIAMNLKILSHGINWCSIYKDTNGNFTLHLTQSRHCWKERL